MFAAIRFMRFIQNLSENGLIDSFAVNIRKF
jgi:hypothetical protein